VLTDFYAGLRHQQRHHGRRSALAVGARTRDVPAVLPKEGDALPTSLNLLYWRAMQILNVLFTFFSYQGLKALNPWGTSCAFAA
jgi:hypothetical protein